MPEPSAAPSVTAIVPTFNNAQTLATALQSLMEQRYEGSVDVICADGGSTDGTRELARGFGAEVIANPLREEEEGRALGLEEASGELVLLLDADNELPTDDWLGRLVDAMGAAPDVVAADCLRHEWRRQDPAVTRLCALMGGTDPLAIQLGWADRWACHYGRWTGADVEVDEVPGGTLIVRLDPQHPPPMGSNGFLVRREPLRQTEYRPFVHSDVVGDLAEAGYRFARVDQGIVHHYAPDLKTYRRKARRRAARSIRGLPPQRRGFSPPRAKVLLLAANSLLLAGPALRALIGFTRRPDPAWALYPLLYAITTLAYLREGLRARFA